VQEINDLKEKFANSFDKIHTKLTSFLMQESELKDMYEQYNAVSYKLLEALEKEESYVEAFKNIDPQKQGRALINLRGRIEAIEPLYNSVLQLNTKCTATVQQKIPFQVTIHVDQF
jgi:ABC-type transporter lipoprotein component MlaA